ncbi:MAG: hypothetical protein AB7E55_24115, partial [Pigmentiphaga sp.]
MSIYTGNPVAVAPGLGVANGSYTDGYIRFATDLPDGGDQFTLLSAQDANATGQGIFSVDGEGIVYVGTGTGLARVGAVDTVENGQNGNALKINFSVPLPNAGFEDGDTNWVLSTNYYGQATDGIDLAGRTISIATHESFRGNLFQDADGLGTVILGNLTQNPATAATIEHEAGNNALYLGVKSGNFSGSPGSGFSADGYQSFHGPYARSEQSIAVHAGENISLSFKAIADVDAYEVFGFLRMI